MFAALEFELLKGLNSLVTHLTVEIPLWPLDHLTNLKF